MRLKENTIIIREEEMSDPHIWDAPKDAWIEASRSESCCSSDPERLVFWPVDISAIDGRSCVRQALDSKCLSCFSRSVFPSNLGSLFMPLREVCVSLILQISSQYLRHWIPIYKQDSET